MDCTNRKRHIFSLFFKIHAHKLDSSIYNSAWKSGKSFRSSLASLVISSPFNPSNGHAKGGFKGDREKGRKS